MGSTVMQALLPLTPHPLSFHCRPPFFPLCAVRLVPFPTVLYDDGPCDAVDPLRVASAPSQGVMCTARHTD